MTALYNPAAGDTPTAAQLATLVPLFARKTVDESIANNTLQDDDELFLTVAASATYLVVAHIIYTGAATPLIQMGWSGPTGATLNWTPNAFPTSVTAATAGVIERISLSISQAREAGVAGAATAVTASPTGVLVTSTTSGLFRFRWAQFVTNATATVVKAGSSLTLLQMA